MKYNDIKKAFQSLKSNRFYITKNNSVKQSNFNYQLLPFQIWKLSNNCCGCINELYIKPPYVFIINIIDENLINVAHICNNIEFAYKDDIIINNLNMFIELWNTYTIPIKWLKYYITTLSENELKNKNNILNYDTQTEKLINSFRKLELLHSSYFNLKAFDEFDYYLNE